MFLMVLLSSNTLPGKYNYKSIHNFEAITTTNGINFSPQKFYEKQCAFCHNERGKIGPPMGHIKKVYMDKYANKDTLVQKMTDFVLNPTPENRLIIYNIGMYGVMPKNMFNDRNQIKKVVEYIVRSIKVADIKDKNKVIIRPEITNTKAEQNLEFKKGMNLKKTLNIRDFDFEYASKTINPKMQVELHKILIFLQENPTVKIEIANHTDSRGRSEMNKNLSKQRALVIKNYFVQKGIDSLRLQTKGYGEAQLLNHCKDGVKCTEEQHKQNRRTEFIVL